MQEYKHNLIDEFPTHKQRIDHLKSESENFKTLAREYHELDHRISGFNARGIPTTDEHYGSLKLRRAQLKDQLRGMIYNTES